MNKKESANYYIYISILLGYFLSATLFSVYREKLNNAFLCNVLNIVNLAVITLVPAAIFRFSDKERFAGFFEKSGNIHLFILAAPVLWCVATYLNSQVNMLFAERGVSAIQQLPKAVSFKAIASGFVLTCVAAPVFEEIFYRGIILHLLKGYGKGGAVIISTMLFAIGHGSITVLALPVVYGLAFGYVTIKSGSVIPAVIMHFICNLISWVISVLNVGRTVNTALTVVVTTVGAVGIVWALIKFVRNFDLVKKSLAQAWGYIKNPLWLPIIANYIYTNIINHG